MRREVDEKELQAPEDCRNLTEYLDKFRLPLACLYDAEVLTAADKLKEKLYGEL